MRDILLQISGVMAIAAALIHGVLSETKIFPRMIVEPQSLRTLSRFVWQIPTVAWIAGGVLLIAAPSMASEVARHWIVLTLACLFALCGRQCGGHTRPAFRLDGAGCGDRDGRGGVLALSRHSGAVRSTELWCAIAHLRISRFRVCSFGASRNDAFALTATAGRRWCASWRDPSR